MNSLLHFATCSCWETGDTADCTCSPVPAWRIRYEAEEQFPWRIWRRTSDLSYEPLMRCSTFEAARQLVLELMRLRVKAVTRSADV